MHARIIALAILCSWHIFYAMERISSTPPSCFFHSPTSRNKLPEKKSKSLDLSLDSDAFFIKHLRAIEEDCRQRSLSGENKKNVLCQKILKLCKKYPSVSDNLFYLAIKDDDNLDLISPELVEAIWALDTQKFSAGDKNGWSEVGFLCHKVWPRIGDGSIPPFLDLIRKKIDSYGDRAKLITLLCNKKVLGGYGETARINPLIFDLVVGSNPLQLKESQQGIVLDYLSKSQTSALRSYTEKDNHIVLSLIYLVGRGVLSFSTKELLGPVIDQPWFYKIAPEVFAHVSLGVFKNFEKINWKKKVNDWKAKAKNWEENAKKLKGRGSELRIKAAELREKVEDFERLRKLAHSTTSSSFSPKVLAKNLRFLIRFAPKKILRHLEKSIECYPPIHFIEGICEQSQEMVENYFREMVIKNFKQPKDNAPDCEKLAWRVERAFEMFKHALRDYNELVESCHYMSLPYSLFCSRCADFELVGSLAAFFAHCYLQGLLTESPTLEMQQFLTLDELQNIKVLEGKLKQKNKVLEEERKQMVPMTKELEKIVGSKEVKLWVVTPDEKVKSEFDEWELIEA
ncbi:MAG: hypothetical protein JW725_03715 [Candidatus Babeliaceae bacterium]|nr:hypothetical protein [Candidatus Babeliaceae bacterium]